MKDKDLAPITSHPAFIETFVTRCKEAGIDQKTVEESYHLLRIKEASHNPDFLQGLQEGLSGKRGY